MPAPPRPIEHAEEALLSSFLDGTYSPGSTLPGERELAAGLGITRPTLREALRRLERDGWLTIRQGKSSVVNDFWEDGGLNVLGALLRYCRPLPVNFVANVLEVRLTLAPAYARAAVNRAPGDVVAHLEEHTSLSDTPEEFTRYDWSVHRRLVRTSGNPVFSLVLNGFAGIYGEMALLYYRFPEAREASRAFYVELLAAARAGDAARAETATLEAMRASVSLWERAAATPGGTR